MQRADASVEQVRKQGVATSVAYVPGINIELTDRNVEPYTHRDTRSISASIISQVPWTLVRYCPDCEETSIDNSVRICLLKRGCILLLPLDALWWRVQKRRGDASTRSRTRMLCALARTAARPRSACPCRRDSLRCVSLSLLRSCSFLFICYPCSPTLLVASRTPPYFSFSAVSPFPDRELD